MNTYLTAIKDVLIVLSPIIVAYISYRSSKKTRGDIKNEVEKITKEKEAETKQILDKINAELESQKQLLTWQNSLPQTNEYTNLVGAKRYGHISSLPRLCQDVRTLLISQPSAEMLIELDNLLDRLELPSENEELFPYEIPIIFNYNMMREEVKTAIHNVSIDYGNKNTNNE